jgi:hypothetical protein
MAGEISTLSVNKKGFASLKTTIPMSMIKHWDPKPHDKLSYAFTDLIKVSYIFLNMICNTCNHYLKYLVIIIQNINGIAILHRMLRLELHFSGRTILSFRY